MAVSTSTTPKRVLIAKQSLIGTVNSKVALSGKVSIGRVIQDDTFTYILVDENGYEIPAVLVDEPVELTATPNDIRIGTTAVTGDGIVTGEKEIPGYQTTEGYHLVLNGSPLIIPMYSDKYQYTKLQVIICVFNKSLNNSVAARFVVINDRVYAVDSTEELAKVTQNSDTQSIDLGLINTTGQNLILRYMTIKEDT